MPGPSTCKRMTSACRRADRLLPRSAAMPRASNEPRARRRRPSARRSEPHATRIAHGDAATVAQDKATVAGGSAQDGEVVGGVDGAGRAEQAQDGRASEAQVVLEQLG